MKNNFFIFLILLFSSCSKDFLNKEPLGQNTELNFYNDPQNAILGINSIYDAASWDEGPNGAGHNYEWMFGDVLSSDAAKGSYLSDFQDVQDLKKWKSLPINGPVNGVWLNSWVVIYRANTAIKYLPNANLDADLKNRLLGEAYFLRGYGYFQLTKLFGGVPIFKEPVKPSEFGNVPRASVSESFKFVEENMKEAASRLPEKSQYAATDLGRATKGAAKAYLSRVIAFQLGTDNTNNHTWTEVFDLTNEIISSGQYGLTSNYAEIFEEEGENNIESIFEIQFNSSIEAWGPIKTGSSNSIIQNNRKTWGWGFNNPTKELVDSFDPKDPRLACTVYKDGDIVLGIKQVIDFPAENETGYLNRKAAVVKPVETKASGQNIRKFRFADVLLLHAEAAYNLNKPEITRSIINRLRERAKRSTLPKGTEEGALNYIAIPAGTLTGVLEPIADSVSGKDLLAALQKERRNELGMEALRFWDEVRWGIYIDGLPSDVKSSVLAKTLPGTNPFPVLPIPASEVESWGLSQNPGY